MTDLAIGTHGPVEVLGATPAEPTGPAAGGGGGRR